MRLDLSLPGALALIERKARQPVESLRVGSADWRDSVRSQVWGRASGDSIGRIESIQAIADREPTIGSDDATGRNRRHSEPFYADQTRSLPSVSPRSESYRLLSCRSESSKRW